MLFPYICDCYDLTRIVKNHKRVNIPNRKPKEQVCRFEFTSSYHFVSTMCPITIRMEIEKPSSSSVTVQEGILLKPGPLPTNEYDAFSQEHIREYVFREIYHSCVFDKQQNGTFCFIYNVVQYIKNGMEGVVETDSTRVFKQKIYDFLRSIIPESSMSESRWIPSKHVNPKSKKKKNDATDQEERALDVGLLQYCNSHLVYGKRWLSLLEGFLSVRSLLMSQQYQDLQKLQYLFSNTEYFTNESSFDEENIDSLEFRAEVVATGKAKFKEFRKGRAAALSSVNRVHNSFSTRFQSWWLTANFYVNDPAAMLQVLSRSLKMVFGFKTSFRPGFYLNTNYRFETKQPTLTRSILDFVCEAEEKTLGTICDGHKTYINDRYTKDVHVDAKGYLSTNNNGVIAIVPRVQLENNDRIGKRQAINPNKRKRVEDLSARVSLLKKCKRFERSALNSFAFGLDVILTTNEEEEEEEEPVEDDYTTVDDAAAIMQPSAAVTTELSHEPILQFDCDQRIATAMLADKNVADSYLDEQCEFIQDQSVNVMEMFQETPDDFLNYFNVLVNELGL